MRFPVLSNSPNDRPPGKKPAIANVAENLSPGQLKSRRQFRREQPDVIHTRRMANIDHFGDFGKLQLVVTLHEEHAEVMRRAISDPNYTKDIDWSDKTIEVTETVEEPVVGKTAHITEEVVIRRQGSDRTQTVHDTVRRQQVEVDHLPVGAGTKK